MSGDFVSKREFHDVLRLLRESLSSVVIPQELARLHLRTTIKQVSTADKDREFLVDGIAAYTSGISGTATTQLWRLEMAGHLVVPRLNEPAATFGDLRNGSYLPIGSVKYRPKGGQPGDTAIYSLPDDKVKQTFLWCRADGSSHWEGAGGGTIDLDKSTQDVKVNGGTAKVSRVGDKARAKIRAVWTQTTMTTFTMTISAVSPDGLSSTTLFAFTAAGAVSWPPTPGTPVDTELDSELFEGAPHFLG